MKNINSRDHVAEKSLIKSEQHFQALFETMTEGVVLISPDGQIAEANPEAERILGLSRYLIESRNYLAPEWEILRPDGTPMPPEEMAGPRAMKERRIVKNGVMGVKRSGSSICWINVSASPLINKAGKLEGVVSTFTDITEVKQTEEALKAKSFSELEQMFEERTTELRNINESLKKEITKRKQAEEILKTASNEWRITFDSANDPIMLINSEMKIIKANLAATKFFLKPFDEILSKNYSQLFFGIDRPRCAVAGERRVIP